MTSQGRRHLALYEGKLIHDLQFGAPWGAFQHVRFIADALTGSTITLTIKGGNGSYAIDETFLKATPNKGFDVHDANSSFVNNRITGVTLSGDQITVTMSQALAVGERLTYGWGRSDMVMGGKYPLGNIRDTDSRAKTIDGVVYELFNPAVIQEWVR